MEENKQLTLAPGQEVAVSRDASLMAVVARAASDPTVDVEKMKALLDMQERLMEANAKREFKAALAAVQAVAPRVTRDGKIIVKGTLRSTYATFEAIDAVLRPLTAEYGFSYRFTTDAADGKNLNVTMITDHRAGHSEVSKVPLPVDANEYRSAVQNYRSTISFAKRCLVSDFFNIVTVGEDDDGAAAISYVSVEQANNINNMLEHTGSNRAKFLEWVGAPEVDKISAARYDGIMSQLRKKAPRA